MIFKGTETLKNLKNLNNRKNTYFQVGVFGKDDSEMTKIAAIHEFGGEIVVKKSRFVPALGVTLKAGTIIKMPSRKWLTLTYERNKEVIGDIIKSNLKKIAEGNITVEESNEIIAISLSSLAKKEMGKGVMKPKNREGTSMVDTGDLRRSLATKINFGDKSFGRGEN
ncbi:MAG: hypothetical protein RR795_01420 [Cetobacterium sp.]|uniref:hypothetical protein n=1 Tax=Cetobacterium sp. TaxID=2071632 RepID=UPI002FC5A34E